VCNLINKPQCLYSENCQQTSPYHKIAVRISLSDLKLLSKEFTEYKMPIHTLYIISYDNISYIQHGGQLSRGSQNKDKSTTCSHVPCC